MSPARRTTLVVPLRGGFANQLFLWAVAERVRDATGCLVEYDARLVERPGDRGDQLTPLGLIAGARVPSSFVARIWRAFASVAPESVLAHTKARLPVHPFAARAASVERAVELIRRGGTAVLDGYLQDTDAVLEQRDTLAPRLAASLPDVRGLVGDEPYAAVHIRRGDYVESPIVAAQFGVPTVGYYLAGIRRLGRDLPVKIVSDDPGWVESEVIPAVEGTHAEVIAGADHFEDFAVLVGARSLVLSNSTFSWWAAVAADHEAVIAPDPWMDSPDEPDLRLPAWIRLGKRRGEVAA